MRLGSLGSGSKGNATLIESDSTCVLVDCGFSVRELKRRLCNQGRDIEQLSAILVTHEHGDHMRGVWPLARRYGLPVYLTAGTAKAAGSTVTKSTHIVDARTAFKVGNIEVLPVAVPHDAREPVQFIFCAQGRTMGVLTDLGSITAHVVERFRACDGLLLEANHDVDMLAKGPYPHLLKKRVGGDWGHLNNVQAAQLLGHLDTGRLQGVVIGHMSEQNNCPKLVREQMEPLLEGVPSVSYASQDHGADWLTVE